MSLTKAHKGYTYQDLLISYFILKEILNGHKKSIFHIDKKHTTSTYLSQEKNTNGEYKQKNTPDRFDDLVIVRDSIIERKQIKYSDEDTDRNLIKNDFANDSKGLALYEVYRTWLELKDNTTEFRLCLAWDQPTDSDIKSIMQPTTFPKSFNSFSTKTYKINIDNLWSPNLLPVNSWQNLKKFVVDYTINRDDFKNFCDDLIIELEFPKASLDFNSPSQLEHILIEQAQKLGIGQYPNANQTYHDFLSVLAYTVSKLKNQHISGEEILAKLKVITDYGKIEQKFDIDQSKNIKFINKYIHFESLIIQNKKTLLIGEPGSGKSWFLTNFIEYLKDKDKKVIRHYCFTSTKDELIEKRISSDVFFGNLIADIVKEFSELEKKKETLLGSDLVELNLLLSFVDEELVIVIDGLDHINRILKNSSQLSPSKTKIIEYISQISVPNNISIVLGSQPVNETQSLIDNFAYIELELPKWNLEDTIELMSKHSLKNDVLEDKPLSEYIFDKSEGNPLYLTYIIKTLINQHITIELVNELPPYDFNLKHYYEYLTAQTNDNLTSEILSCLDFPVSKQELEEIIPRSSHLDNNLKILSPVISENISKGGIKLYHDSFRRYNIEKLEANANLNEIYSDIAKWLKKRGFYKNSKSYRYLLSYYVKLEKYKKVKKYATNDFLTQSLYNGYPEYTIKKNYDNFLNAAQQTQDWALFVYISEINRNMNATISEHYNEFEEKFEQYFEAIGLIYGFERANDILFFDGKQNFSDVLIAKAFYISQKNGYIPNWKKIEHYFKDEISLDKYKYFIAYLIAINNLSDNIRKNRTVLFENLNYLKILVEEVHYLEGFEKILFLYERCSIVHRNIIANKINNILDNTNCTQRILVKNQIEHLCLPKLNLDFIDDYIREGVLDIFFSVVKKYAIYNLKSLEKFEESIPSENFFYNWIKFTIRNYIIENNIINNKFSSYNELEKVFTQNFRFLASDVEPYKGTPRVIDFTYRNERIIDRSIEQALKYIQSIESWSEVIDYLNLIPYNTISIVEEKFISNRNIQFIINSYKDFNKSEDEYYSSYLEYKLKLSIYYAKIEKKKKARINLLQAMRLVTSYTSRKDITLDEIIEPLDSIERINRTCALEYTKKLLPLNLTVQNHSEDGKGIHWLYIGWFKKFLQIDRKLASSFLISRFLKEDFFWKYEYMFSAFLKSSSHINPIILNYSYKLMPTFIRDDDVASNYVSSFADNIYQTINMDEKIARESLVNILERGLNSHSEQLSYKSLKKLQVLKNILNVSIPIQKSDKEKASYSTFGEKRLDEKINESLHIEESLKSKNIEELNKYFDKKDRRIDDRDIMFLIHFINELNDDKITKNILDQIIQKRLLFDDNIYEMLRLLVNAINCNMELKIYFLVNIFVFSQDGWFQNFVSKESLEDAIRINKESALKFLAEALKVKFHKIYYYSQSTANLITAFEYAEVEKKHILSMYKRGFEFIEYRIPHSTSFDWQQIEDQYIESMNDDEIALTMMLSKMRSFDVSVQREIILAVNYMMNYDCSLLLKPFKCLFEHIEYFPHLSIAGLFELFLLYVDSKRDFFQQIKDDLLKVEGLENLTIQKNLNLLLTKVENV